MGISVIAISSVALGKLDLLDICPITVDGVQMSRESTILQPFSIVQVQETRVHLYFPGTEKRFRQGIPFRRG